ncbi:hypothetical protein B5807_00039 [Epicoccum nigrum]|uniref:N-acetyltransferase domain-containing protein n=1 Tax=Epicoccum nigrum TaxID=105696 RepID=A0A1Y2MF21_EPING|nr:hypothetical protein B5807_00039 [Epicoccum nigrum]
MAPQIEIAEARPSDAQAISSLFALSWVSPFTQLQFGKVDPSQLATSILPRIAELLVKADSKFVIARRLETSEVIAVAQWTVPEGTETQKKIEESEEDRIERQHFEDEAYRCKLPDGSNKELIMAFTLGLRRLREETLQGREHFLLENLATHPDYRGRGLASQLIEWATLLADKQQVPVYLDTASDNPAARLYKRHAFEEQGRNTIADLTKYAPPEKLEQLGCDTQHTHVAFLRSPRTLQ